MALKLLDADDAERASGRWTAFEHDEFLRCLAIYGREWKKVEACIKTRTAAQIRSHAQKYFKKAPPLDDRAAAPHAQGAPAAARGGGAEKAEGGKDAEKSVHVVVASIDELLNALHARRDDFDVHFETHAWPPATKRARPDDGRRAEDAAPASTACAARPRSPLEEDVTRRLGRQLGEGGEPLSKRCAPARGAAGADWQPPARGAAAPSSDAASDAASDASTETARFRRTVSRENLHALHANELIALEMLCSSRVALPQ
ncbi:hypothetical protein M885DRAFT_528555 [Pelagophyceae sp. CCMP2097]|nr:hypothetical protein M885DRAFT_528555 [Pelagophyceae sp. CCMP2097]